MICQSFDGSITNFIIKCDGWMDGWIDGWVSEWMLKEKTEIISCCR